MLISVLTTTFNSARTIASTIESFLAQTHPDKEMILLDGLSRDDTLAIVESYRAPEIKIHSERDAGLYDALNKGIGLYSGDAMGVLNSDDTYHDPTVLARVAEALTTADMVHGDLDFVTDHQAKAVRRRWRAEDRPRSGFRLGWMPAHPTCYARRSLVDRVGLFDLSYRIGADYDWLLRAIDIQHAELARIDHVMIDMMTGGLSTSGWASYLHHGRECLRSRQRWLGAGPIDLAFFAKPARKLGQLILPAR